MTQGPAMRRKSVWGFQENWELARPMGMGSISDSKRDGGILRQGGSIGHDGGVMRR